MAKRSTVRRSAARLNLMFLDDRVLPSAAALEATRVAPQLHAVRARATTGTDFDFTAAQPPPAEAADSVNADGDRQADVSSDRAPGIRSDRDVFDAGDALSDTSPATLDPSGDGADVRWWLQTVLAVEFAHAAASDTAVVLIEAASDRSTIRPAAGAHDGNAVGVLVISMRRGASSLRSTDTSGDSGFTTAADRRAAPAGSTTADPSTRLAAGGASDEGRSGRLTTVGANAAALQRPGLVGQGGPVRAVGDTSGIGNVASRGSPVAPNAVASATGTSAVSTTTAAFASPGPAVVTGSPVIATMPLAPVAAVVPIAGSAAVAAMPIGASSPLGVQVLAPTSVAPIPGATPSTVQARIANARTFDSALAPVLVRLPATLRAYQDSGSHGGSDLPLTGDPSGRGIEIVSETVPLPSEPAGVAATANTPAQAAMTADPSPRGWGWWEVGVVAAAAGLVASVGTSSRLRRGIRAAAGRLGRRVTSIWTGRAE